MSVQIKAKFESVDAAEIASRYLRAHLEGIERIDIVSRKNRSHTMKISSRR